MSPSDDALGPSERTSLLDKDSKKPTALSTDGENRTNGNAVLEDEETGSVQDGENESPLLEGNDEMRRKMWLLFPAVSLGVSCSCQSRSFTSRKGELGKEC